MKNIKLPYSNDYYTIQLPETVPFVTLQAEPVAKLDEVERSLEKQIDAFIAGGGLPRNEPIQKVCIAVPDETRPTPLKDIIPMLLKKIKNFPAAIKEENITIIVGGGLHPPLNRAAIEVLLPKETVGEIPVISHDARSSRFTHYGKTSRQTPVAINSRMADADLKITVGQIDPHQFVGFTGGCKGVIIGTGSAETIEHNHSLLFEENARVGVLDGNPVREDLNEAGQMVGIDLAVNVVLNPHKEVVGLFAGAPDKVLRQGANTCSRAYGVPLSMKFDIVIASCGGFPKDSNLYQAQKGLNLASQALKPNGRILLLAACEQGVGDPVYYDYASSFQSIEEAMADFSQRNFQMGLHKCYLFGCTLTCHEAVLHTELDPETIQRCLLDSGEAQRTINFWIDSFPGTPSIGIVPHANTTYFY